MKANRKKTAKATGKTKQVLNKRTLKSSSAKRSTEQSKSKNPISEDTRSERLFSEKLNSLSTIINSIQTAKINKDNNNIQEVFKIIFDDITFFLKLLPKIKNTELLTAYNKTYKKLDDLIKSVTINLDSAKIFQTDTHVKNTELDGNNFLVEIIKDNDTILYRKKYKDEDENTIVDIYSEDGKEIYHYKRKPDGNKDTLPSSFINNTFFGDTIIKFDEEKPIDESQYTVREHMIVNKKFYESLNNKGLFDNKNSFNLKLINSLFDFIALQSALSKKERQKNISVSINLSVKNHNYLSSSVDNALQNNHETLDTYSKKEEDAEAQSKNIPLFGNIAIYKGKNNLLYSGPKVGKTYLSIEIAKSKQIKNPLFIALDSYDPKINERYINNLKSKIFYVINLNDFDEKYKAELYERKKQAEIETLIDANMKDYHRIKNYNRQNYIEMGIIKDKSDKLNKIAVIEKIIQKALDNDHDFICLDCLNSIVEGSGRNFSRKDILKIIKPLSERNVTLLLLHHTTKQKNQMALTQELRNIFDNIYFLEERKRIDNYITELELIEEEARDNAPHTLTLRRTINANFMVHFDIIKSDMSQSNRKNNRKYIKDFILDIIEDYKTNKKEIILYKSLIKRLKELTGNEKINEANIMKLLKTLNEEGIIEMKDGSTWKGGIRILK